MHRAVSASRRRHGEPAASENAVTRTSAATQPSAEAELEPRSAASRARVRSRRARAPTNVAQVTWMTPRASRSEREPPPAWLAGGEQERRRADERSDAAEHRGGAGSSRGQRLAEQQTGRGEHEHRRTQHERHECRRVQRSEREPPPAWRAGGERERRCAGSAATQPRAEAALARAADSGEQGKGRVEESTHTDERSTCAMSGAIYIAQRA